MRTPQEVLADYCDGLLAYGEALNLLLLAAVDEATAKAQLDF